MTNDELTINWERNFPNFLPIAYDLKKEFNDRWFRIHTLPESKRYPENEDEYQEIFRRHNLILSDLFGTNQHFVLITMGYGFNDKTISADEKLKDLRFQNNFWLSIDVSDETDKVPYLWNLFYDELKWKENLLDNLFRFVVDDEIREIMLFSTEQNFVYHPYDGGADIICQNSVLKDKYKEKYKDWLSKHPKGL
jgi:hypothetical protein